MATSRAPRDASTPRGATSTVGLIAARILGAALTAAMGGIHLDLWVGGYRDIPTIGVLFLLNAIGAVLLAIALLVTPVRLLGCVSAGGALLTAGTLAALLASLTGGVFGFTEYLGAPLNVTTIIVEAAGTVVLTALTAMWAVLARRG